MSSPQGSLGRCYSKVGRRPLTEKHDGNIEYTVHSQYLKVSRGMQQNITVIAYGVFSCHR